jgi:hypothetical protein
MKRTDLQWEWKEVIRGLDLGIDSGCVRTAMPQQIANLAFDGTLSDATLEVTNNSVPVLTKGLSQFFKGCQSTSRCPSAPAFEKFGSLLSGSFINVLQCGPKC